MENDVITKKEMNASVRTNFADKLCFVYLIVL